MSSSPCEAGCAGECDEDAWLAVGGGCGRKEAPSASSTREYRPAIAHYEVMRSQSSLPLIPTSSAKGLKAFRWSPGFSTVLYV